MWKMEQFTKSYIPEMKDQLHNTAAQLPPDQQQELFSRSNFSFPHSMNESPFHTQKQ